MKDLDIETHIYEFGDFTLDVARGCAVHAGKEIRLRPKVFETLKYLVQHPGRLIGKQELMKAVWPDSFVTDDSLVQCALELRRALNDREQRLFKTVPRRGYLFAAEVLQRQAGKDTLPEDEPFGADLLAAETARKRHDLPMPRTSLVGREQQVSDASTLLLRPDVRLLSITGPGGAGKTRLAIAVAYAVRNRFSAGLQFVSLASITNPDLVATAIAAALETKQTANRSISNLIGDQLQNSGPFLLVLDNFEQVLPAATIVAEILEACPSLKILVTSRSCLHVYGEQEFPLSALEPNSALELFVQRAAAVLPGFAITPENTSAVQEICGRLDGLPLAIELAAARLKVLSPPAILDRLQSRLQLLTGGARDLPKRHQTLRGTIEWSYDLLNEAEARLFRRLAVFTGGCTLEASEAACNTRRDLGIEIFEGLSSLLDKNLVHRSDSSGAEPRFAMLETMREYALERLVESGEQADARRAHAAYYLVLAEEGNPELSATERAVWLAQCDSEIDNLRSALEWLAQTGEAEWNTRFCLALFRFWDMREYLTEGRMRLETVLGLVEPARLKERAKLLHCLGALAAAQGDYTAASLLLEQGLSLYDEMGDKPGIAVSLNGLAVVARDRGDYASAQNNFERSLACWRMLSDPLAIARCLHNLANVVRSRGDYPRALRALREAAQIFGELGDRTGAAWCINQQGDTARAQGEMDTALELYQRALSCFRDAGDLWGSARSLTDLAYITAAQGNYAAAHSACREALGTFVRLGHRRGIARALEASAFLAVSQGQATRALRLAAAAAHLRDSIGAPRHPAERSRLDRTLLPAWEAVDQSDGRRAWEEGKAMSIENAIQYSLEDAATAT